MTATTIITLSGHHVDPFNMKIADINIIDIAHSLSMQCRYNGHIRRFYSVAEHSVLVSQHLPDEYKLCGLLHDATEAYVGDMVSPVKQRLDSFNKLETDVYRVVATALNMPDQIPEVVHKADRYILEQELKWIEAGCDSAAFPMVGLEPSQASKVFMDHFIQLRGKFRQNNAHFALAC